MSRLRGALAALVAFGAMTATQLGLPGGASACSCFKPDPNAPVFSGQEPAVFIGTAGQPQADGTYRFAVERWYVGGNAGEVNVASERIPGPDGAMGISTCGLHFEVGDRLILSASIGEGVYRPGLCSPHAVVASDEGTRLVEAAEAAFGPGIEPGGQPPGAGPGVGGVAFGIDITTVALGGIAIIVVLVVLVTVYAVGRRGPGRDEA